MGSTYRFIHSYPLSFSRSLAACRVYVLGSFAYWPQNRTSSVGSLLTLVYHLIFLVCVPVPFMVWPTHPVGGGIVETSFHFLIGRQPTRDDRCTYVCYDGAFKDDDLSSGTKISPKQVSYYVDSPSGEMTRDESFDIAIVRQSFAVEERLFSLCHAEGEALYQQQRYLQKKSEDCAWTLVVYEELLRLVDAVEHQPGWYPYQIKMVMPKWVTEPKPLELLFHSLVPSNISIELPLWREKVYGGC